VQSPVAEKLSQQKVANKSMGEVGTLFMEMPDSHNPRGSLVLIE
jgi:hypothetical protein